MATALEVRADRLRGIVARWRKSGYAQTGTLATGPAWCWLTAAGMKATGLGYPATRPSLGRLAHIRAVLAVRLWLEAGEAYQEGQAWWRSERRIRAATGDPATGVHVPDAEIHWPSLDGSPYAGQIWAIEAELTAKPLARTAGIMQNLLARTSDYGQAAAPGRTARYAQVIYLTSRPAAPVVTRAVNVLPAPLAPRIVIRDLPKGVKARAGPCKKPVAVAGAGAQGGGMGFFDDAPAPVPEPLWRHHHPWDPPEAEFPGIVPIDTTLLGRTDQAAVAITGLAAFSNGFEIQLTARSRPGEGDDARPGLGRAGRSLRFGLQLPDGRKAFGRHGPGRPGGPDKEPEGPLLQAFAGGGTPLSFLSRWWAWPLPPKGALEFVAEWPDLGLPESRVSLDAGMILDAADRAIRLWPEPSAA